MSDTQKLSASLEDYIEAIYAVVKKKQAAKAKDIAQLLHVKASSVTGALKLLAEKGLINYAPYDIITLTPEGEQAAKDVVCRHQALSAFFVKILGLDAQSADDSACKLEHAVSSEILVRLTQFVAFVEQCPRAGVQWVKKFNSFCNAGGVSDGCKSCLDDCVKQHRPKEE